MAARLVPILPSRDWSEVLFVSRLSTKCNEALGNEKQMAASGWQFVPPAILMSTKLSGFFSTENIILATESIWCQTISIHFINTFARLELNSH